MSERKYVWKYAFLGLMITVSIIGFGRMAYGILVPFMMDSLSLTYGQAGVLGTSTAVGYLAMVLYTGILAAKWGSKRLVVIGTLIVGCGLFFLAAIQSFTSAIIIMAILGIGTAFAYTPIVNIVVGWFPERKGLLIGFLLSGIGLGTFIPSLLIPTFINIFSDNGWRALWLLFGLLSILVAIIAHTFLSDPPVPLLKDDQKETSLLRAVYFNKKVVLVAFIYGLMGFAYLIPQNFYFSYILESNINSFTAGRVMSLGGLMSVFSGPLWGAVSDKVGRKKSLLIALFLAIIAMIIPVFFPVLIGFTISQFIWGVTIVGMFSLIQALATDQTLAYHAPVALAYVTVYFAVGQLMGPGIGGWIIEYLGSIPVALVFCSSLLTLAFLLSVRLEKDAVVMSDAMRKTL
ncbi:YbfB/YjiJ family MFS transporter [Oceanobacillus sp. CF4.6]|uniref:YbfB/YjiJ family MFS transporter n=1 Tax=Oceanobacillus sp. CF4.6 TaxID=3373080 RepID=UPI003EE68E07